MSGKASNRARRVAAEQLAKQRAAERRRRAIVVSVIALAVLVLAAGIGVTFYLSNKPENVALPRAATTTGLTVGKDTAPVTVDVYLDFQCPICKTFEDESGKTLQKYVDEGVVKIAYHPVAYLDRFSSGTKYSSRSSAASGCASDAGKFPEFLTTLYANQPEEGGSGLTDATMVSLAEKAGITGDTFEKCVEDQKYADWTKSVTDEASKAGVNGTPTVKVNGTALESPTTAALTAAVDAARR
ncbi:DsbA family protein [Cryptosporangium arvum]|uniref:Protein-disulfide isomerase n=1 Tax=Cryptosporangium arvum DSM 44712 TaxID=927661 RepID=A0A010YY57_9ACTN|nr:thioredoxin domain-containing protein [Cryptosporangium arvum]EXG80143.1 protein-disulfide isomerase [Cryptosporangium arvum DSM 44712]